MKPTVINNSNSENTNPPHQENSPSDGSNVGNGNNRRFPQFPHGFGFEGPDEDVFENMGLRSRMNRMGHPFDWTARKRRGSGQGAADPYDQYFRDEVDFPHFGSTWDAFNRAGNKRSQHPSEVNDRSGFFNYLPPEFRQYIPDDFGFSGMRHPQRGPPAGPHSQYQVPLQHQQQQQPQPQPQQQQQQPNQSRSNLCDAAIQTEDLAGGQQAPKNDSNQPPNEGAPNNAGNSAPQNQDYAGSGNQASAFASSTSTPYGNQTHISTSTNGPGSSATATATNPHGQYYQQSPYGYPHPQQHQQFYQPQQGMHTQTQPQHVPPHVQQQQFHKQQTPPNENYVRTVPIFFEGSNVPVNVRNTTQQQQAPPNNSRQSPQQRPEPFNNKEAFQNQQHQHQQQQQQQPQQQPQQQQSAQTQQQTPENSTSQNQTDDVPPQTPHTADCISKIQAIQRDVLDLMCAVEQFGGSRGDKDYMYLDEMLTRNLLKLDTIDTNGKDSIRLARKEAIKCIQASIAVLEAKADLHLNANQQNTEKNSENSNAPTNVADGDKSTANETVADNTNNSEKKENASQDVNVAAEIPKVQENVENISIEDPPQKSKSNEAITTEVTKTNSGPIESTEASAKNTENTETKAAK